MKQKQSLSEWLDDFEDGEIRYKPFQSQDAATNFIRQVSSKTRRKKRTKSWTFYCTTFLAVDVKDVSEQHFVVQVVGHSPSDTFELWRK